MDAFSTVIYEKRNGLAHVVLNRPQVANVFDRRMRDDLYQILQAIRCDSEVKGVILRGAGEKGFCAGADLREFLTAPSPIIARRVRWRRDLWGLFSDLPQPLIAALHGYVLGSGLEMALFCDLRLAAEDARFGLPEAGLGIIPAAGGTQTLPRTVGPARALEMIFTGRWIDSGQAQRIGLVNRVVPRPRLLEEAEEWAGEIASWNVPAVRQAKQAVRRGLDLALAAGLELEKRLALELFGRNF